MLNKYAKIIKTITSITIAALFLMAVPSDLVCEELSLLLRTGEITSVVGEVDIKRAGKNYWTEAEVGLFISQLDIIRTSEEASVDVEFAKKDGKYFKFRLREKSRLRLTKLEVDKEKTTEDILLELAIGDILIKVDKQHEKSKFQVRTPVSMVGVRGTKFRVMYK
ncbi:MAG: FecR family protein [Candidatus Omnitrophota bacterium]